MENKADPDDLREKLWEQINRYAANRGDLNARSQAVVKINEIASAMIEIGTKKGEK